ncbi:AAA family ATPase [Lysobacter sp. H21R4]|uniref:AAA family ATPase n=1 Tax=Lysobacter sp. H21R4 TaxID=2781021 RepID=UPI0018884EC8|nr:ATP-binding protein [Lysobacter sp. H21R4]QOY61796.1 AAA family ATPase [Lysobacter sp. H21R4]
MITRLKLTNFTSFGEFEIDFSPKINVIIGENGSGKTQLLKAAYGLCAGALTYKRLPDATRKELAVELTEKLVRLFMPLDEGLGRLRRNSASSPAELHAHFASGAEISCSFGVRSKIMKVKEDALYRKEHGGAVFVPTKEVLSLVKGIMDPTHDQRTVELIFDAGYVDLAQALMREGTDDPTARLNQDPRFATIVPRLINLIGGRYRLENGGFCFQAGEYIDKAPPEGTSSQAGQAYKDTTLQFLPAKAQSLSSGMTAEGFRKIGILHRLLSNGTLDPGHSGPLLWDEPESNLNPLLMKQVVEILFELSRNGQQVILATHDYVLLKWFDLLMDKGQGDHVRFHGLYRDSGHDGIMVRSVDDYNLVGRSAISDVFAELYDEDVKRALGGVE